MLLAGDAEVNVGVDEGGQSQQPIAVDRLRALDLRRGAGLGQLGDFPVANHEVAGGVQIDARVKEPGAADDQGRGLARATDKVHAG